MLANTVTPDKRRNTERKNIAIVGTGISGLSAAWLLARHHDVTLYEANDYIGGHSHTVDVTVDSKSFPVDTGFIVYNPVNYPNLTALFEMLGVETAPSDMSFSASLKGGSFEYAGGVQGGLLAQPMNIANPQFWQMLAGILRFYRNSARYANDAAFSYATLGELLTREGYSRAFIERHIAPMGAAIWSSDCDDILDYPAWPFIRFFENHGLTRLRNRPAWRTVQGGSRQYVDKIAHSLAGRIHCATPITGIVPGERGVQLQFEAGTPAHFDDVVLACHSDQALALLAHPNADQRLALGSVAYSNNEVILHTDTSLMPQRRRAWASWNFIERQQGKGCLVSYWMNRLQPLPVETPVIVTLNPDRPVDPAKVLGRYNYAHPVFSRSALTGRRRTWHLQGRDHLWYCGAWLGDGFHEDGIQSGLAVAEMLGGEARPWQVPGQNRRIGFGDDIVTGRRLAA